MNEITQPVAALEDAYQRGVAALTDHPIRPGDAVAWLSAHLAAVEHAVYPVASRAGVDPAVLAEQRRATHSMLVRLRTLEQMSMGGPVPSGLTLLVLRDALVGALAARAADERALLTQLFERLDPADAGRLVDNYAAALLRGPTRPHPWGAHAGRLERLTFTFDRLRDRILDALDARVVPLPRPPRRRRRPPGRWGQYLLGGTVSERDGP